MAPFHHRLILSYRLPSRIIALFCNISVHPHRFSFYAPATDKCVGGIRFWGRPSATACVRAYVRPEVGPVSTITPERVEGF